MSTPSSQIIVRRRRFGPALAVRMKVIIDEEVRGELRDGAVETFSVTPGDHTVKVSFVQSDSEPFHVALAEGEVVALRAGLRWRDLTPSRAASRRAHLRPASK